MYLLEFKTSGFQNRLVVKDFQQAADILVSVLPLLSYEDCSFYCVDLVVTRFRKSGRTLDHSTRRSLSFDCVPSTDYHYIFRDESAFEVVASGYASRPL